MFSFIKKLFKDPQATETDVNLLLLGETGVGKSTFINSISAYFKYSDFKKAGKSHIDVLIPTRINSATGEKIVGDSDENEKHDKGASATQHVKVYLFPIKLDKNTFNLKLIDTPGVGDPRGLEQDNINLENVLTYLATLKKLHGICFILKSNQTRFTKFVEYCLKEILSRLDKSAKNNIIFIITYSKTYQYNPGETLDNCLQPLVKDIQSKPPHVTIPLSNQNVFSLDNEGFKALLEMQDNKRYTRDEVDSFSKSWSISSKECRRLLTYILGDKKNAPLPPHNVENTLSINEVRFLIEQLGTPLAEVSDIIQDNLRLLDRHKKNLNLENQTLDQLKKQLYIPCVELKVTSLTQPVTVCTHTECTDIVKVNDVTEWHYRQKCHNPCYLKGVPKEMVGDPGIINCAAMSGAEHCTQCNCHWKLHMHIYKSTEKVQTQTEDENVKTAIQDKEDGRKQIQNLMQTINNRMSELQSESNIISDSIAKFSCFLQEHALTPFNDAYSDYIRLLIKNEKHLGKIADLDVIDTLEKLLSKYEQLQKTFQTGAQNATPGMDNSSLSPQSIKNSINDLYNLKHMGPKIQELISKASACRKKETQKNFGCVVSPQINLQLNSLSQNNDLDDFTSVSQYGDNKYYYSNSDDDNTRTSVYSGFYSNDSATSTTLDSQYKNKKKSTNSSVYTSLYSGFYDSDDNSTTASSTSYRHKYHAPSEYSVSSSGDKSKHRHRSSTSRHSRQSNNSDDKNSVKYSHKKSSEYGSLYSSVYDSDDNSTIVSSKSHRSKPSLKRTSTYRQPSSSSRSSAASYSRRHNKSDNENSRKESSQYSSLYSSVYDSDDNSTVVSSKSHRSKNSTSSAKKNPNEKKQYSTSRSVASSHRRRSNKSDDESSEKYTTRKSREYDSLYSEPIDSDNNSTIVSSKLHRKKHLLPSESKAPEGSSSRRKHSSLNSKPSRSKHSDDDKSIKYKKSHRRQSIDESGDNESKSSRTRSDYGSVYSRKSDSDDCSKVTSSKSEYSRPKHSTRVPKSNNSSKSYRSKKSDEEYLVKSSSSRRSKNYE